MACFRSCRPSCFAYGIRCRDGLLTGSSSRNTQNTFIHKRRVTLYHSMTKHNRYEPVENRNPYTCPPAARNSQWLQRRLEIGHSPNLNYVAKVRPRVHGRVFRSAAARACRAHQLALWGTLLRIHRPQAPHLFIPHHCARLLHRQESYVAWNLRRQVHFYQRQ